MDILVCIDRVFEYIVARKIQGLLEEVGQAEERNQGSQSQIDIAGRFD
jgi:hypothetical protein